MVATHKWIVSWSNTNSNLEHEYQIGAWSVANQTSPKTWDVCPASRPLEVHFPADQSGGPTYEFSGSAVWTGANQLRTATTSQSWPDEEITITRKVNGQTTHTHKITITATEGANCDEPGAPYTDDDEEQQPPPPPQGCWCCRRCRILKRLCDAIRRRRRSSRETRTSDRRERR
jgi:hypothetical protein